MGNKSKNIAELKTIPGVGREISEDLWGLGIKSVRDLKGRNPDVLYKSLCKQAGKHIDRCMLYIFRCAVYYASNERHNPELLKWWNWKDSARKKK